MPRVDLEEHTVEAHAALGSGHAHVQKVQDVLFRSLEHPLGARKKLKFVRLHLGVPSNKVILHNHAIPLQTLRLVDGGEKDVCPISVRNEGLLELRDVGHEILSSSNQPVLHFSQTHQEQEADEVPVRR